MAVGKGIIPLFQIWDLKPRKQVVILKYSEISALKLEVPKLPKVTKVEEFYHSYKKMERSDTITLGTTNFSSL